MKIQLPESLIETKVWKEEKEFRLYTYILLKFHKKDELVYDGAFIIRKGEFRESYDNIVDNCFPTNRRVTSSNLKVNIKNLVKLGLVANIGTEDGIAHLKVINFECFMEEENNENIVDRLEKATEISNPLSEKEKLSKLKKESPLVLGYTSFKHISDNDYVDIDHPDYSDDSYWTRLKIYNLYKSEHKKLFGENFTRKGVRVFTRFKDTSDIIGKAEGSDSPALLIYYILWFLHKMYSLDKKCALIVESKFGDPIWVQEFLSSDDARRMRLEIPHFNDTQSIIKGLFDLPADVYQLLSGYGIILTLYRYVFTKVKLEDGKKSIGIVLNQTFQRNKDLVIRIAEKTICLGPYPKWLMDLCNWKEEYKTIWDSANASACCGRAWLKHDGFKYNNNYDWIEQVVNIKEITETS